MMSPGPRRTALGAKTEELIGERAGDRALRLSDLVELLPTLILQVLRQGGYQPGGGSGGTLTDGDKGDITVSGAGSVWTIDNFSERVDDRVAALLTAGANISLTYNDAANTLTIAASGGGGAADSFETVAKNLAGIDNTGDQISASTLVVTYANGIVKTIVDSGTTVTITLSGSTPGGIDLVKTITLTGDDFAISYS